MVQFDLQQLEGILSSEPPYRGVKGSIVRLKVVDFMTYHKVELHAGPNVNLIMGPNGTGKSTIVCAICIGLAGKPKILGRASSLKEYIRHDCKSATIEIELFNPDGENWVIKRHIAASATMVNSTWYLNGKRASQTKVENLLADLNIQLDNLCQFLPQDRVQEFSKMDAQALLRSTQSAMGKDTLILQHDQLIELNNVIKQTEHSLQNSSDVLRKEEQINKRLENEVKIFHERERFKKKISELKGKKAWLAYIKDRNSFSQKNEELEKLKAKKKEEESKLEPLKKSLRQLETKLGAYNKEYATFRNTSVLKAVKTKYEDECDKIEVKVNEITSELEAVEKNDADRVKKVEAAEAKLKGFEEEMQAFAQEEHKGDVQLLERRRKKLEGEITKLSELIYKLAEEISSDEHEMRGLDERMRLWRRDIERLGDLRVSRMKYMQRERRDAFQAVNFFSNEENKAKLKGKIHEPMILHICVNDLKYGPVVERHIGIADMTAFFCEDKDDVEVVLALMKPLGIRISVIHHEAPPQDWQKPKPCFKPEFLRQFCFQKTLVELIQAPDYYMSYITKKHKIHTIPIGKSPETDRMFNQISKQTQIQAFYTDENGYYMKKSNYGSGICSSVDFLPPARVFTTNINAAERERLEEQVEKAAQSRAEILNRFQTKKKEMEGIERERGAKEEESYGYKQRWEYYKALLVKIENTKRTKEFYEKEIPDLEALREKADRDIWNQREKLTAHLEWVVNEIEKYSRKGRQQMILKRQIAELQRRIATQQGVLEDLQTNISENNAHLGTLSDQVKVLSTAAERSKKEAIEVSGMTSPTGDVKEGKLSIQDVDRELTQLDSQMAFLVNTDPSIVKDYQERLKTIEKLTQERGQSQLKLTDLKKELEKKKEEWLTPLKALISTINDNFGRFFASMGCVGEVSLCHTDVEDDFTKYGIKLLVKFRENEPLAEVCGTRVGTLQSGGERVITTALYILALQELTVVPFRVIDEINQGMDAKNESRFFNLLCSLARGDNTPQYFLLTPKMLPPVDYPDNVDFHIIMNGPKVHIPYEDEDETSEEEDEEME